MTSEELADKRRKAGITQQQLAEMLGTDQETISRWENGRAISPHFKRKLREVLK